MKPPAFDYAAPTQVAEVIDLLTAHADADPRVIAGGQSLVPLMNFRLAQPGILIDLQPAVFGIVGASTSRRMDASWV